MANRKVKYKVGEMVNGILMEAVAPKTDQYRYGIFVCPFCDTKFKSRVYSVVSGHTTSCGCSQKETQRKRLTKHGHCKRGSKVTTEYRSWRAMLRRCYTPEYEEYENYGGRGIVVCERWRESFVNFLSDMGKKATKNLTLERLDTNGNYEAANCKWGTPLEQSNNRRDTIYVMFNGQKKALGIWCNEFRVPFDRVYRRLERGWDLGRALMEPNKFKISHDPGLSNFANHSFGYIN